MTPRQATNMAHGIQKRVLNEYESTVLVHRNVYTLFHNYLRDAKKYPNGWTPQELYPTSMDKKAEETKPQNEKARYLAFWSTLRAIGQLKEEEHDAEAVVC